MKNFVQDGNVLTLTAPGNVSSGDGVLVGTLFGIAAYDAGTGEEVEVSAVGVFELPKGSGQLGEGAAVSWDNSAHEVVTPGAGKYPIGVAVKGAGSSDTTVRVRLSGVPTAAAGA